MTVFAIRRPWTPQSRSSRRPPHWLLGKDRLRSLPYDSRLREFYARVNAPRLHFDSSPPKEASGFRALKITFVDDISDLCETRGVNVNEVMRVS